MAGLIQQEMGGAPDGATPPPQGNGAPAMGPEAMQGGAPMGVEDQGGDFDENQPDYKAGVEYLNQVLYSEGAAKDISQQLKAAPNLVDGMSSIAYDITTIVDERTDGKIPDEMLVPMAMKVLEEVVEIADATGLDPKPEDIAESFKKMILRYLQEQGIDTTQLDQAMSQVDPSVFNQISEEKAEA